MARFSLLLLLVLLLTACERALGPSGPDTPVPTPTALAQAQETPLPATATPTQPVATATQPAATATPTAGAVEATVVVGDPTQVAELLAASVVVERLELDVMESMPVQVRAKISGHFSLSCTILEDVTVLRQENSFIVQFHPVKNVETPCVEASVPFSETITLDVAGLPAGSYTLVAGEQVQSFTLDADSVATTTPLPQPSPSVTPVPSPPVQPTLTPVPGDAGVNVPVNGLFTRTYIHLIALEDAGASGPAIGCGDSVIPVIVDIEPTVGVMTAAFNRLLSIKDQFYGESGLYNALYQSSLTLSGINIVNGVATVSLSGQLVLGGTCDAPRVQAQLEQTALQYSTVSAVNVLVNGIPLAEALSQQ